MPKFLGQWFGYCLVISFFVAYLTGHTLDPGAHYLAVFRVAGTAAFLAYARVSSQAAMLSDVSAVTGVDDRAAEELGEMEQSAIKEAGNILSSAYLNALSEFMGMILQPSPPHLVVDMAAAGVGVLLSF